MIPRSTHIVRALTTSMVIAAAGGVAPTIALAQCDIYRPGLPDFDQRRAVGPGVIGLPGNGSVYCVPSSAADAIAYIANHGAPELTLGDVIDWTNPSSYNAQSALIAVLGALMGTGGSGTGSTGFVNGLTSFFNDRAPGMFVASTIGWSMGLPPRPLDVNDIMAQGGFPLIVRGFYSPEENNPGVLTRTGGHVMLARHAYDTCTASPELGMRDPNTSVAESMTVNSPWAVYRENLNLMAGLFRLNDGSTDPRLYWEWSNDYGSQTKLLDGIMVIMPTFAVSGALIEGEESVIDVIRPVTLTGAIVMNETQRIELPDGIGPIVAIEMMPDLTSAIVVTRTRPGGGGASGGKVSMQDFHFVMRNNNGFHEGPEFPGGIVDTSTSPAGGIYIAQTREHILLNRMMQQVASIQSQHDVLATGYDDNGNTLVVLARGPSGPLIQRFPADLSSGPIDERPCPPNVVIDGPASICVDPADGTILVASEGVPSITRLRYDSLGRLVIAESIGVPQGMVVFRPQVSDTGSILFTSGGRLVELQRDPQGSWSPATDGLYTKHEFGHVFSLTTSRDGMDVHPTTGPNTTNIADEVLVGRPDCRADFNDDGSVNSQDLFDYLRAFFALSPFADLNDSGAVNSQDFFDFLAAFFSGC